MPRFSKCFAASGRDELAAMSDLGTRLDSCWRTPLPSPPVAPVMRYLSVMLGLYDGFYTQAKQKIQKHGFKTSWNKGLLSWDEVDLSLGDVVRVLKDHTELQRKWFIGVIVCVW